MFFRKRQFPLVGGRAETPSGRGGRADPSDYDYRWEKLSISFRKKNPFCRFCEQEGYECSLADDVDHIIPIQDGGARFDPKNLQSLCRNHHNGKKERLQRYARRHGLIDQLPVWCEQPDTRPNLTVR